MKTLAELQEMLDHANYLEHLAYEHYVRQIRKAKTEKQITTACDAWLVCCTRTNTILDVIDALEAANWQERHAGHQADI
jgi:hypothetical protein